MSAPDARFIFCDSIDYDLYANRLWLPFITSNGTEAEVAVFKHLLAASTVWVKRLEGESVTSFPDVALSEESLADLHRRWLAVADCWEYNDTITYRNTKGEERTDRFGDIARHALNHGTYHRGQLRGMYGAREAEFPETDFIGFAFRREAIK